MKKLLTLALCIGTAFSMAACGSDTDTAQTDTSASADADSPDSYESDVSDVLDKGTLVVGITDFEPMDYRDDDGNWIGFDADMATAFAESIGVDIEFVEIDWANKISELEDKTIDCVWNGMTLTDEAEDSMECTNAYCKNAQVAVVPSASADQYQDTDSLSGLTLAVEAGSSGEEQAQLLDLNCTPVKTQSDALTEVASGTSDAAIIDSLMAAATVGEGTGYPDLTCTVSLDDEEYSVGFRRGSDLAAALNNFFISSYDNGSMLETASKYGIQDAIMEQ